ncbi:MAG: DedA family protein [Chlamydiae bacterium]|nr:DedA family protein [Chlamydiota bacterium]
MAFFEQLLSSHANHAHWWIFLALLLAGCNIPISIDALVIISALIAANYAPENTWLLYTSLLLGCSFSAWISYSIGRFLGPFVAHRKPFSLLFSEKKKEKIKLFYQKYGIFALLIGRFIPFGVRNCLFMTSGLSRMPFLLFALCDALACFIWVTFSFVLFLHLGQNFDRLWIQVRSWNLGIFLVFSMAVIATIWYKYAKKRTQKKPVIRGSEPPNLNT